ncbi:MFS transporter [Xylophilus ampelinus]|uniref:DHA2 family multidrug resistance protein-like MFS transporter n=1 Tax=Xylophilus ampelinus TaxID=54067 RepID=A0A318SQY6_9BURK|nr:MFS transporter [Xylophilus ampelinus]MCS4511266.1 MFS transporter [Xylophilus ampelinus]PYE74980.1 DHA2 family multidrug resistance protein-like MFS transporter [Xylophilus ampelinus]
MAVIILGMTLSVLDGSILNLALPGIAHDLGADAVSSIWIVNAYQVATLGLLLPLATLGDTIGYRRVYLGGLALFTVASVGCILAHTLGQLVAARAVQGVGAAGMMGVNAAMVRLVYPRKLLGRGVAINSVVVATASVAGPTVAAAVLSVASWPWLFAINLPLGLMVLLGGRALPRNTAQAAGARLSVVDVLLNVLMFGLVFLGADALGTRTAGTTGGVASGVALLAAGLAVGFFYLRRQSRLPLFPVDLLRIQVFALSMCTSVAAFAAQMLAYIALPFLLLGSYGRSHLAAGLLITAWPLAIVAIAPVAGRLIGRVPDGLLGGIGLGILATGLALLAALPAQPSDIDVVWRMAMCGIGFGLFQSPNNHTIVTTPPAHRSGGASGMLGTARLTGQTLGAVLLAIVFSIAPPGEGRGPIVALGLAALLAAGAGVFSMLRLRKKKAG